MFSIGEHGRNRTTVICLISALALFLEMLAIRWIGTEVRIFAYLQNTILIVCFLGFGLGCFTCRQPAELRQTLLPMAVLLLLMAIPASQEMLGRATQLLNLLGDFVIWSNAVSTNRTLTPALVMLGLAIAYFLLVLVVDMFVPIGRLLGRLMDEHPQPIRAYSANVAGSLVGTWLFVLLSYFYAPPVVWFAIVCLLLVAFLPSAERDRRTSVGL